MEAPLLFGRPLDYVFINEEDKVTKRAKGTNSLVKSQARKFSHAQKVKKEGASCEMRSRGRKVKKRVLKQKDETCKQAEKSHLVAEETINTPITSNHVDSPSKSARRHSPLIIKGNPPSNNIVFPLSRSISRQAGFSWHKETFTNSQPVRDYIASWLQDFLLSSDLATSSPSDTTKTSPLQAAINFSTIASHRERSWEEYFLLKGEALRRINSDLGLKETGISDENIAAVFCVAIFENDPSTSINHQVHMDGLKKMVMLRGGVEKLGFGGMLAKIMILCDILKIALEGTPSYFITPSAKRISDVDNKQPQSPPFSTSSPIVDCCDLYIVCGLKPCGPEIASIIADMNKLTRNFRSGKANNTSNDTFLSTTDQQLDSLTSEDGDNDFQLRYRLDIQELSKSIYHKSQSEDIQHSILATIHLASLIYTRVLTQGVRFGDERNWREVQLMKLLLEKTGVDESWEVMPCVLFWVLLTGAAASERGKDWFLSRMVKIGRARVGLGIWRRVLDFA